MSSRSHRIAVLILAAVLPAAASERRAIRFCVDPNNMPLSNSSGEGLENRVASLVAADLGVRAEFIWWPARRGYVRNTLGEGRCDVLASMPAGADAVLTTRPYYETSYVFVFRSGAQHRIASLDDPALARLRIGMQVVGEDYAPPSYVLAKKGIIANVVPFSQYGAYGQADPQSEIVHAVATGKIDVAIVWGPVGGYFAAREPVALEVVPIPSSPEIPGLAFSFAISMAVRRDDEQLREALDHALARHAGEIQAMVREYAIPEAAK